MESKSLIIENDLASLEDASCRQVGGSRCATQPARNEMEYILDNITRLLI